MRCMRLKTFKITVLIVVLLLSESTFSYSQCYWTIDANFWGDAKGSATVRIHCSDGTGMVSVSSNRGSYDNIPIDASGDDKSVIMSGSGIYGIVSYSGVAKGKKDDDRYSGTWKVKLIRETDGKTRTYSGKWQGTGNYSDICKIDICK
jgi:hypothetical protein